MAFDVLCFLLIVDAALGVSSGPLVSLPSPLTMTPAEGGVESGAEPGIRLEPLRKNTHLPGKTTPSSGSRAFFRDIGCKVTANGVHDIEDRILRITGYYGYNPGYSSHRSE